MMKTFDVASVPLPQLHQLLLASIAPRPIAFVSSIDKNGTVNLSPFSFFNVFGSNPPTLIFSPNNRVRDDSPKHTLQNVLEVKEVVIHVVDYNIVEAMSLSSAEYSKGVNEFHKAGFTEVPSVKVKPPRVKECKVAFECVVRDVVQMNKGKGGAPNLIICEVLLIHISDEILNDKGTIDTFKTDWVSRMGEEYYSRATRDSIFKVGRPQLGIGFDVIPEKLKSSTIFTFNELAKLAGVSALPDKSKIDEVANLSEIKTQKINFAEFENYIYTKAKDELTFNNALLAWCYILQVDYK